MVMDEIKESIGKTKAGDIESFGTVVLRFQDMVLGFAYSILKDLQLAEDAAQEAFLTAYLNLDSLRDVDSLPGWLRQIVFTKCNRITRRKELPSVDPQNVQMASTDPTPDEVHETTETRRIVAAVLGDLPPRSQQALALFYISGLSYDGVAELLEVPVSTVKKRLHDGRKLMKERLKAMTETEFHQLRLSRSDEFSRKTLNTIRAAIDSIATGDVPRLEGLVRQHPALIEAAGFDDATQGSYFHGATLLHYVAGNPTDNPISPRVCDIARVLLRAGADPNAQTYTGNNTPLCLVASGSAAREAGVQKELLEVLIDTGADVNAHDGLATYAALIHGETEAAATLHQHGARLDLRFAAGLGIIEKMESFFIEEGELRPGARSSHQRRPYYERSILRGGQVVPHKGTDRETVEEDELPTMTNYEILVEAFAYAIINRQLEAAQILLDRGVDIDAMPARCHGGGQTPLHFACGSIARGGVGTVEFLMERGSDLTIRDCGPAGATPLQWAIHNGHSEIVGYLKSWSDLS